jgi:hypothetical protein
MGEKRLIRPISLRTVFLFVAVAICTLAFAMTAMSILAAMTTPNSAGTHDFVEYWASAHLLARHGNPYDSVALQELERSVGFPTGAPTLVMGNPPSALLLVLPLGYLGPVFGEWLWLLLQLAALVVAVRVIHSLNGHPQSKVHLLAYAFAPTLACLLAGQVAVFLLLGLVLFLRWQENRPIWAGASLWLCLLKPHLFLPFGVVLLLWMVVKRNYGILLGTASALAMSSAVATAMDPQVWLQYRTMMAQQRIDRLQLPCLSTELRQYVYPHTVWVQCLPLCLGSIWAIGYYWKRRAAWDWIRHGSTLMLVSVLVAPYTWFMDQAVLIPAMLAGAYATRSRTWITILALMSAGIEIEAIRGVALGAPFYLLTAPAWLIWFLVATRSADHQRS